MARLADRLPRGEAASSSREGVGFWPGGGPSGVREDETPLHTAGAHPVRPPSGAHIRRLARHHPALRFVFWGRQSARRGRLTGAEVSMATGGVGLRAFIASCSFALLSFARASEGERASGRAAGCPCGVPWGRGSRVEVREWWFGTMSTDATEDDMDLTRTEGADLDPPECQGIVEVERCIGDSRFA